MAIDTNTEKLAIMEWDELYEPGLPLSPGTLGQDDKQQLLWGFPGVLWAVVSGVDNAKLAHMEWCLVWEPAIPTNPGTLGQDDKQQLIWGFPDVLWAEPAPEEAVRRRGGFIRNIGSMMTR